MKLKNKWDFFSHLTKKKRKEKLTQTRKKKAENKSENVDEMVLET